MRTVLCTNGLLGARAARFLHARGDLVGLVLHGPERQRDVTGLGEELGVPTWEWPGDPTAIAELAPECLLSVLFGHRLDRVWLDLPSWLPLNLHPGLLPWNAGANPNVWPLVDGTPAGTTLHVMTEVIDDGDIVAQRAVPTTPADTGETLYGRLMEASFELLTDVWPIIRDHERTPMPAGGSRHRSAELTSLDLTEADFPLLDRLRARTFAPWGAELDRDGRRWRVRVAIEPIDEP